MARLVPRCSCYLHGCRCGYHGDPTRECLCTGAQIQQYLGKISGPLLDRIDLHIEVPALPHQELRGRVLAARGAHTGGVL
jgi:predicted ATPase with chaperone activity